MKILTILTLALTVSTAQAQQTYSVKSDWIKSMTYSQCIRNPTVQFAAELNKQKYPSISTRQMLDILCKEAR